MKLLDINIDEIFLAEDYADGVCDIIEEEFRGDSSLEELEIVLKKYQKESFEIIKKDLVGAFNIGELKNNTFMVRRRNKDAENKEAMRFKCEGEDEG